MCVAVELWLVVSVIYTYLLWRITVSTCLPVFVLCHAFVANRLKTYSDYRNVCCPGQTPLGEL